ncbi:MAG: HNH endonuclease [Prevotella sp.]|nr:HNH endonuclease [Prevotella sp.]
MQTSNNHSFSEHLSDFYHYLTGPGGVNAHSRTNYISWLKFLDEQGYALTEIHSYADIDDLLVLDASRRSYRTIYTKPNDTVNFKSALRKYLKFRQSDYAHQQQDTILAEVNKVQNNDALTLTERDAIVKARIGQGKFREKLVEYWRGCSISTFSHFDLLIASHIKPWKEADNQQRLDVFNGLLLLPNYDKLFDKGYISFDDSGYIIYSRYIDEVDRKLLNMGKNLHLIKIEDAHKPYLKYHRDNCLML